jgi:hypothetical protein
MEWNLRRKDQSLADELAFGVGRDGDSVATRAWCAADKCIFRCCIPATMANVCGLDLAVIGIGG